MFVDNLRRVRKEQRGNNIFEWGEENVFLRLIAKFNYPPLGPFPVSVHSMQKMNFGWSSSTMLECNLVCYIKLDESEDKIFKSIEFEILIFHRFNLSANENLFRSSNRP